MLATRSIPLGFGRLPPPDPASRALVPLPSRNLTLARDAATPQEDGEEAQVELPSGKGPQLPFAAPPPLRTPLLDVTVPLSLPALWLAFFHNASNLLADFHQRLGDRDVSIASWRRLQGAAHSCLKCLLPTSVLGSVPCMP